MQKFIISSLFLFSVFFGYSQDIAYDDVHTKTNKQNIVGDYRQESLLSDVKIKQIRLFYIPYKYGKADYSYKLLNEEIKYDSLERIVENTKYVLKGNFQEIFSKLKYYYGEGGFLVRRDFSNSNMNEIFNFKYDINGNIIEENSYVNNALEYKYVRKYNNNDKMTEEVKFDKYGITEYKSVLEYDEKGNTTLEYKYDKNGNLDFKYVYNNQYDSMANNLVKRTQYLADGRLIYKITSKYDDKKNLTEEQSINGTGTLNYKNIFIYNKYSKIIKEMKFVSTGGGIKRTDVSYKYDKNKNLVSKVFFNPKLGEPEYEYIYEYIYW